MAAFWGEQYLYRDSDGAAVDLHHRLTQVGLPGWRHEDEVPARAGQHEVPMPDPTMGCLLLAITIAEALLAAEPCAGPCATFGSGWEG